MYIFKKQKRENRNIIINLLVPFDRLGNDRLGNAFLGFGEPREGSSEIIFVVMQNAWQKSYTSEWSIYDLEQSFIQKIVVS